MELRGGFRVKRHFTVFLAVFALFFPACKAKGTWQVGMPMSRDMLKIGVVYVSNPDTETSGWSYSHAQGIQEMQRNIGLANDRIMHIVNLDDIDKESIENALRNLIANGANLIIATTWGYMEACEKLSKEFPNIIFAHASGNRLNGTNFTNYFGRVYQARYLAGLIAGMKTKSGKIGYVAAMGKDNSEVSGGLDAFAIGVERVNPNARVYVKVTHVWFDPMGEANAARQLIASGCDVIAQHCDTANPQIEAEKAHVFGIGYHSDMRAEAPHSVLTSVIWKWGNYYTELVNNIISGKFVPEAYFGSLKDGVVDIAGLNQNIPWDAQTMRMLQEERQRIISGDFDVFDGVLETNTGEQTGKADAGLSDEEIQNNMHWYYHTVAEL